MIAVKGWSAIVVVVFLVITTGRAQDDPAPPPPAPPAPAAPAAPPSGNAEGDAAEDAANGFIVPTSYDDDVDSFTYETQEYLTVNKKRRYKIASTMCRVDYGGQLAVVDDKKLAAFLAEALSETNLMFDSLWTAGRTLTGNDSDWKWDNGGNESTPIDPELIKKFKKVDDVEAGDRNCLAFARDNHEQPDYRKLACNAERAAICQRPKGSGHGNSTHPGWIKIGVRYYKIFSEMVTWDRAVTKCFQADPDAQLAVIVNFNYSQLLGRYLLINRPSLENAWIGARWHDAQYRFEPEQIDLNNISDVASEDIWPPWRNSHIQKVGGCILLDRHLDNLTRFVEARCERLRPYICYKPAVNQTGNDSFSDIIIGNNGYRLYFGKRSWDDAVEVCNRNSSDYGGQLATITTPDIKYELLYVMGENRTAIQHIWLAGKFVDPDGWTWVKDKSKISLDMLDMVQNSTYNEEVESMNICLDMDRENHIKALHYGTACNDLQNFVCAYTKDNLLKLEQDERRQANDRIEQ